MPLKRAREKRNEARRLLTDGINPAAKRVPERAAAIDSFEAVACEWFAKQKPTWAESHADKVITRLEQDLFPWLGAPAVGKVTAAELPGVPAADCGHKFDAIRAMRLQQTKKWSATWCRFPDLCGSQM